MIDAATLKLRFARQQMAQQRAVTQARDGEIRKAAKEGMSTRQIAKVVGLSHQRVAQIINEGSTDGS